MSQKQVSLKEGYVVSRELEEALLVAEVTGRPLLIKGEPGTGKTLLAEHISKTRNLPIYKWHVKSTSLAKDGLYFYDAVSRLNDSRFSEGKDREKVHNIENYIRMGPLGLAFESKQKCIVLIDEIDKADLEFPNDLLLELDQMEFVVVETNRIVKAKERPLTIITSNNERELPDAFLRRCIFHYIEFPSRDLMEQIIRVHLPDIDSTLLQTAMKTFYKVRRLEELKKKPSTSELLDWIQILLYQGAKLNPMDKIPFVGALIKNEEDLFQYSGQLHVPQKE
ncbi:MAG TPA: MoxR family ATPase [Leptospiraceae bacterium]|nr:MoxR family ATPase [Leptospiraceae bacterium]HMW03473.1 MoxR family ATPase [Leptospiraceae bacterium]HMX31606.1 MoxR family ATPase [Leptospiraceae bacterium]HMY29607.1 MoxR family ATPase [Leptospiraceae bacterium]HMZ62903.1 MoxR family ATPase [Leptospiraceae bacterium]